MSNQSTVQAEREKRAVALRSVLAAVFLTGFKLVVGLLSNSLGILSEAAHSGLDLVAALVTYFAVRIAGRPADEEHHFGHGKVENFSALIETLLLLATCVWIVYEAVRRLVYIEVEIEASIWTFLVMGVSIVVDVNRSRMLYRAARKHHSQALEADALHFQTDIWSSSVVIVGLGLVRLADLLPNQRDWLIRADALAALVVAAIVVVVSVQLGRRTIQALMDQAPEGLEETVRAAVISVEQVQECNRLRLRTGGPVTFVEATVRLNPNLPTVLAHEITTQVAEAVSKVCSQCDVSVIVEPEEIQREDILGHAKALAAQLGLSVHDVHVYRLQDGYHVDLDLVVPSDLSLEQAHLLATEFESLQTQLEGVVGVETHIEVAPSAPGDLGQEVTSRYQDLAERIRRTADAQEGVIECHNVRLRQAAGTLYVSLHCLYPGDISMDEAHRRSSEVERKLHEAFPDIAHFLVHAEPGDAQ